MRRWCPARPLAALGACAALLVPSPDVRAQPTGASHVHATPAVDTTVSAVARFITDARRSATPFADRARAVAAGYRRLGPDFPFGAEHWVNPVLMADDTIVADRPEVLLYVPTPRGPSLVGVAYVLPREPHERTPEFPAPSAYWHDHWSSVNDEVARSHDHMAAQAPRVEPRVAMLHLWLFAPNPDGVFALEHRGLPLLRLGVAPDSGDHAAIGWMGALAHGAGAHFAALLHAELRVEEADAKALFDRFAARAIPFLEPGRATGRLALHDAAALVALGRELAAELGRRYGERAPAIAGAPR